MIECSLDIGGNGVEAFVRQLNASMEMIFLCKFARLYAITAAIKPGATDHQSAPCVDDCA